MQTNLQNHLSSSLLQLIAPQIRLCWLIVLIGISAQTSLADKGEASLINLSTQQRLKWVGSPVGKGDEPWFVCLVLRGSSLLYTTKLYAIQARHQSWTAEWRRHRPKPYQSDEGVGLVTTNELAQLHGRLENLAQNAHLKATITLTPPKCEELPHYKQSHAKHEYMADVWLRKASTDQALYQWSHWTFIDPHLDIEQSANQMIKDIIDLVTMVAEEREDLDLLLTRKERGHLILKVTAPSRVWINGVFHGEWPSSYPIMLAPGLYQVQVKPLNPTQSPVIFEGLEITAETKTKFKVEVE
jgi:hypothetical protein